MMVVLKIPIRPPSASYRPDLFVYLEERKSSKWSTHQRSISSISSECWHLISMLSRLSSQRKSGRRPAFLLVELSEFLAHSRLRLDYAIMAKSLAQEVICTLLIYLSTGFTNENLCNSCSLVNFKEDMIAFLLECSAYKMLCDPKISTQTKGFIQKLEMILLKIETLLHMPDKGLVWSGLGWLCCSLDLEVMKFVETPLGCCNERFGSAVQKPSVTEFSLFPLRLRPHSDFFSQSQGDKTHLTTLSPYLPCVEERQFRKQQNCEVSYT